MISELSFTGFDDAFIEAVGADFHVVSTLSVSPLVLVLRTQGLHLPHDLDIRTLQDEPLSHDVFGLPMSLQILPFPTSEYLPALFQEIPPDIPSIPGVTPELIPSLQTSHETVIFQPCDTVRDCPLFFSEVAVLRVSGFTAPYDSRLRNARSRIMVRRP